jgi:hypothetical protein
MVITDIALVGAKNSSENWISSSQVYLKRSDNLNFEKNPLISVWIFWEGQLEEGHVLSKLLFERYMYRTEVYSFMDELKILGLQKAAILDTSGEEMLLFSESVFPYFLNNSKFTQQLPKEYTQNVVFVLSALGKDAENLKKLLSDIDQRLTFDGKMAQPVMIYCARNKCSREYTAANKTELMKFAKWHFDNKLFKFSYEIFKLLDQYNLLETADEKRIKAINEFYFYKNAISFWEGQALNINSIFFQKKMMFFLDHIEDETLKEQFKQKYENEDFLDENEKFNNFYQEYEEKCNELPSSYSAYVISQASSIVGEDLSDQVSLSKKLLSDKKENKVDWVELVTKGDEENLAGYHKKALSLYNEAIQIKSSEQLMEKIEDTKKKITSSKRNQLRKILIPFLILIVGGGGIYIFKDFIRSIFLTKELDPICLSAIQRSEKFIKSNDTLQFLKSMDTIGVCDSSSISHLIDRKISLLNSITLKFNEFIADHKCQEAKKLYKSYGKWMLANSGNLMTDCNKKDSIQIVFQLKIEKLYRNFEEMNSRPFSFANNYTSIISELAELKKSFPEMISQIDTLENDVKVRAKVVEKSFISSSNKKFEEAQSDLLSKGLKHYLDVLQLAENNAKGALMFGENSEMRDLLKEIERNRKMMTSDLNL